MKTVSVVIPTIVRDRELLVRAVRSAFGQTARPSEIIVVIDRPERAGDVGQLPGATVVVNSGPQGPAAARNVGIRHAHGEFVAFLDDDDYWHPTKLAVQLAAVDRWGFDVVACRARLQTQAGTRVMPTKLPSPGQPLTEFFFVERGLWRARSKGIATPALLARRSLLMQTPFDEELQHWEDTDWLLRVVAAGASFGCLRDVLLTVQQGLAGPSQSAGGDADAFQRWAKRQLGPVDVRAHQDFTLTYVVPQLVREGRRWEAARTVAAVVRSGPCSPRSLVKAWTAVVPMSGIPLLLTGSRRARSAS